MEKITKFWEEIGGTNEEIIDKKLEYRNKPNNS